MEASRDFTQHLPSAAIRHSHKTSSPGTIADRHYLYHPTSYRNHRATGLAGCRITSVSGGIEEARNDRITKKAQSPLPMSNYADA